MKEKNEKLLDPQRRNVVSFGVSVALMFGLGAIGKTTSGGKKLLRPPGGQDEDTFISRCIKCDRCRSICPTSVLAVASINDGFIEDRTPVMNYHLGFCTFCNKCVEVCPTKALEPFDIRTVKIGVAKLTKNCIALDGAGCAICYEACKYSAISLNENNIPIININRCNGCGICENVCPALVLRSYVGGKVRGIEILPIV